MKKHTLIYFKFFGYCETDVIMCEIPECQNIANDIHHIKARAMGGNKDKDLIENLQALCRFHHDLLGDKKQHIEYLQEIHLKHINEHSNTPNQQ